MALQQLPHVAENHELSRCIDDCLEAAQACEWCADECAGEGEEMASCIRMCRDVADLTTLHARFMARNSTLQVELATLCAEACEACADECANHDHEHCRVCAAVLRDCAKSCRNVAGA